MSINKLITEIKENGQDFEFYPTSSEIIDIIKADIKEESREQIFKSILDCGAGNGQTLNQLTQGKKYAIEKSQILISNMPANIFIVGTDFYENSLIDKKVDIVFSNPPYTQYKEWSLKIINEANANTIFLVIPERWKNQPAIISAIEDRQAKYEILGTCDFLEADRKSRAKVDIVKIKLGYIGSYSNAINPNIDPFSLWAEKQFPINNRKSDFKEEEKQFKEKINELVPGRGITPVLVELYQNELQTLQNNFSAISGLDLSIFSELKIDFKSVVNLLKARIINLKTKYWRELFDHFAPITDRLTTNSRKKLLETLTENISVDFNENNIYAVTLWAIKNANFYFDQQLIDVFVSLSKKANCIKYKSNIKTWGNDGWRFSESMQNGNAGKYCLDYRCVLEFYNAFNTSSYDKWDYPGNLYKNVHAVINDIIVIAKNLGFICPSFEKSESRMWEPGKTQDFYLDKTEGNLLMSVKAFKNGNLHFKFNQKFLKNLNIEFGRLKGWLHDHKEASTEMDISEAEAKQYFKNNFALECSATKLLN